MKNRFKKFVGKSNRKVKVCLSLLLVTALVAGIFGPVKSSFASVSTYTDADTGITWYYEVDNGKAINVYTTDNITSLLMLTIPDSIEGNPVKSIGGGTSETIVAPGTYTSVKLPGALESINENAFKGVTSLKAVNMTGTALETVGNDAFNGCTSLANIKLETVTSVGNNAFKGCTALTSTELKECTLAGDGVFQNCTNMTKAVLPACKSLGDSAFEGCTNLEKYRISSYATKVGNKAFKGCKNLKKAYIPDTVTNFGTEAFAGNTSLTDVQLDADVNYANTFVDCKALKNVIFGENVTEVAGDAFSYTERTNTYTNQGAIINYYFLNPKTKIYQKEVNGTWEENNIVRNTSIPVKDKSLTYTAATSTLGTETMSYAF